jgi:hypothetical protein
VFIEIERERERFLHFETLEMFGFFLRMFAKAKSSGFWEILRYFFFGGVGWFLDVTV